MSKKRKLNSKNPKYWDKSQLTEQEIKKKVHACTTHQGVKVYAVWYKQCARGEYVYEVLSPPQSYSHDTSSLSDNLGVSKGAVGRWQLENGNPTSG